MKAGSIGHNSVSAACLPVVIRTVPIAAPWAWDNAAMSLSNPARAGANVASSRSPAAVGATLRVVRASRRKPSWPSSRFIVWLKADWVTPSRLAARVKLRSAAIAAKMARSPS